MDNYCEAGEIKCGNLKYCEQCFGLHLLYFDRCPWPPKQVPVEKPHDEHDVKDFFQESVNQTVDTVRAYRQGRFDMKREIGDEVKKKIALRWCVMSSEGILLELQEYIEGVK